MKLLFSLALFLSSSLAMAVTLPDELTGIWTTPSSEFHGHALVKGEVIYLDSDGVGAVVGGSGSDVLGVRIVVLAYDELTHVGSFQMTEYGKGGPTLAFHYEPATRSLVFNKDGHTYQQRRQGPLTPGLRKSIGLEDKSSLPP